MSPRHTISIGNRREPSALGAHGVRATSSATDGDASPAGLHMEENSSVPPLNSWMQGRQPGPLDGPSRSTGGRVEEWKPGQGWVGSGISGVHRRGARGCVWPTEWPTHIHSFLPASFAEKSGTPCKTARMRNRGVLLGRIPFNIREK
jgi:hypothetical protein